MKPIMAICDREIGFTNKLIAMFREKPDLPFEVHGFTEKDILVAFCREHPIALLVISELDYQEELKKLAVDKIFILRERGTTKTTDMVCVNKFQSASSLYKEIMTQYAYQEQVIPFTKAGTHDVKIIGLYSPVHRSLQTTMALTMGQILAEKSKSIYLNFECFSGLDNTLGGKLEGNLTDIMYFYECAREKLPYRLESIVQDLNGLKIVPPAQSYRDFATLLPEIWKELLLEIAKAGNYKYMILDLSEQMPGLFSVLRMCDKIYTMEKADQMAQAKIAQYELLLGKEQYEDILSKTEKCKLPVFKQLPHSLVRLNKSELALWAQNLLGKDGYL